MNSDWAEIKAADGKIQYFNKKVRQNNSLIYAVQTGITVYEKPGTKLQAGTRDTGKAEVGSKFSSQKNFG